jgi:hypothetical protein
MAPVPGTQLRVGQQTADLNRGFDAQLRRAVERQQQRNSATHGTKYQGSLPGQLTVLAEGAGRNLAALRETRLPRSCMPIKSRLGVHVPA